MWSRVIVVIAMLGCVLVAEPGSAAACRCTHRSLSSAIDRADVVFYGEVTAVVEGSRRDELTVSVRGVWKGVVDATVVVRSTASSCGIVTGGARVGTTWLFVGHTRDGTISVRQCDGTRRATRRVLATVERIAGPPAAP